MANDSLDILISRYAAGEELAPAEMVLVQRELDGNVEANEMLATEHRLTELLRAAPLPEVDYDRLAARISASLPAGVPGIAVTAQRSFWSRPRLALVASVLIAIGVAVPLLRQGATGNRAGDGSIVGTGAGGRPGDVVVIRAVDGSPSLAGSSTGTQDVTIGPSGDDAAKPPIDRYGATTPQRPSRVVIAGEKDPSTTENPLAPR